MGKAVILLPRSAERAQDSEGYVTDTVQRFIRCRATFKDTTRADEALASQDGYTASIICEIDRRNYSGQSWFEDADTGEIYDIRRTHNARRSMSRSGQTGTRALSISRPCRRKW